MSKRPIPKAPTPPKAASPGKGGSYVRDPVTGGLTRSVVAKPQPPAPVAEPQAPDAPAPQTEE